MADSTLIAVFSGEAEAAAARQALIDSGVSLKDIAMSANLTNDGIAAEAPGQAYENQGTVKSAFRAAKDSDTADAHRMADVQRGSVVLTVTSPAKVASVTAILKRFGAVAIRR